MDILDMMDTIYFILYSLMHCSNLFN